MVYVFLLFSFYIPSLSFFYSCVGASVVRACTISCPLHHFSRWARFHHEHSKKRVYELCAFKEHGQFKRKVFFKKSLFFLGNSFLFKRGGDGSNDHEGSRRMKTELLIQMDGLAKSEDLVVPLNLSRYMHIRTSYSLQIIHPVLLYYFVYPSFLKSIFLLLTVFNLLCSMDQGVRFGCLQSSLGIGPCHAAPAWKTYTCWSSHQGYKSILPSCIHIYIYILTTCESRMYFSIYQSSS